MFAGTRWPDVTDVPSTRESLKASSTLKVTQNWSKPSALLRSVSTATL